MSKLNTEEKNILKEFEADNLKRVKNLSEKKLRYRHYAKHTLNKSKSINIRISEKDLQKIKALAVEKGLPYQTFISSIIHQHSNKKVKEKV